MKLKSKQTLINDYRDKDKLILIPSIITHLHDYTQNTLKPIVEQIYTVINDRSTLHNISLVDCIEFEKICHSNFDDENFVNVLLILNAIFKSDDLESLKTCELYQNVLNGINCRKPSNSIESLNIVYAIRKILLNDYEEIINTLEDKNQFNISNQSTDY